jgi:hypothetical protein
MLTALVVASVAFSKNPAGFLYCCKTAGVLAWVSSFILANFGIELSRNFFFF